MKTPTSLLLSFLLFTVTKISFLGASSADTPVFDVLGDKVLYLNDYYIDTAPFGNSTVLGIAVESKTCPNVVLSDTKISSKISFSHPSIIPTDNVVQLGLGINVHLSSSNPCNTSTDLLGINTNIEPIPWHVVVGGHDYDVLKIDKYNSTDDKNLYKFRYCPHYPFCRCKCVDIGYGFEDGVLFLVPGRKPVLPIVFTPAKKRFISQIV